MKTPKTPTEMCISELLEEAVRFEALALKAGFAGDIALKKGYTFFAERRLELALQRAS